MNDNQTAWNKELVNENFPPSEVKQILSMPLSWRYPHDSMVWHYTKMGFYTVWTAYHIARTKSDYNASS